jgi:hypothetical protein
MRDCLIVCSVTEFGEPAALGGLLAENIAEVSHHLNASWQRPCERP